MGINSKCYIPNDVSAEHIVEAIAYLCGARREKNALSGRYGGYYAGTNFNEVSISPNKGKYRTHKVFVRSTHNMQFFTIEIAPTNCDNEWHSGSLFMYPDKEHLGYYCLYAGVSKFWNRVDRALVDMFGGYIDDNDCDSIDVDYRKKKPRKINCPNDGDEWQKFQDDMLNLPHLFKFVGEE